jgi:hypothetical protein
MMASAPLGALHGLAGRFRALPRFRRWAALASVAWAAVVGGYAIGFFGAAAGQLGRGTVFLDGMFFLAALVLPLILVWLAAWLAEELERQREVIAALAELTPPLFGALDATRAALDRHGPASPEEIRKAVQGALAAGRGPDLSAPVERLLAGQAQILAALRSLVDPPAARAAPEPPAEPAPAARPKKPRAKVVPPPEPSLPLLPDPGPEARPGWAVLIRALDFPRDADDAEGFRALAEALRHHSLQQMLQAAEDVLNLLSQEGVYMDDLAVAPCDPAAWRRFMEGARGAEVTAVGGIRDPHALETARRLTKVDPIFRDTALFFQRRFDVVLSEFADGASDAQIAELAGTRSGRAFMLLARLSGSFG